jgi:hypothetical protein
VKLDWSHWLYGLFSGFIGGGATAGTSFVGLAVGNAISPAVHEMDFKQLGTVFLSSGIVAALFYLKQSPLPQAEDSATKPPVEPPKPT